MSSEIFFGVRIQVSELAATTRRHAIIAPCVVKKRRRAWTLRYKTELVPCVYRLADGMVVMHPTLYRKMLEAL